MTRRHSMSEVNTLRRRVASLEKALHASSNPTVITRLRDGLIVQVNESMADLTGYSRAELIGQTALQLDLYTDPADHQRLIAQVQTQGQVYGLEARLRRKSGEVRQVVMSATPAEMNGESCAVIVISDITAFKWLERALRQSEHRYRLLFDGASDAIYIHDLDGRMLEVNQPGYERLGYSHTEMRNMTLAEIDSADQSPLISQRMVAVCERGDIVFETTHRRRDGTLVPVEVHARRIEFDSTQAVLSVVRDITERKQAEARLVSERNLLRTLIDNVPDSIYIKDTQSRYLMISDGTMQWLGAATPESVLGKTDFDLYPHEMAARFYADEQRVMQSGQPMIGYEEPVLKISSGELRWVSTTQVPLRDADGQVTGLVGIGRDITDLKHTEDVLKQSQQRLELALQGADLGWYDWNVQTNEVVINDRYAEMVGYSVEEMQPVSKTWETLFHPDDRAHEAEETQRELEPPFPLVETQSRIRSKDGEWRWILDRSRVVAWDEEGRPLRAVGTHLDITPRKCAEDVLKQSQQRLELALLGADLGWYDWNVQTNEVLINDRYAEMVGYSVEEMQPVSKTWETLLHPEDRAHEAEAIQRELTPPFPLVETESRVRSKDGEWRWILDRSKVVVWDAEGRPLRAAGMHLDITLRKRAEQEKERLQAKMLEAQKRSHSPATGQCHSE